MMKKFLLGMIFAASAATAQAQYQFPNSDFESAFIGAGGSNTEPRGWHGYATIDASGLNENGRSGAKLVASTDVRPGSTGKQSVYVKATSILGIIANGVMTNGQIYTHSTTATDGTQNYNFSEPGRVVDSYAPNSQFYTPFKGKPDAMRVWLKNMGSGTARVCVWLHTNGKMCDPTNNTNMSIVCANAVTKVGNNKTWTQYDIPFKYNDFNGKNPEYILATFTTNETPGKGADGDIMYIDDIEMLYYSDMRGATYAGNAITLDAQGNATIDAAYNEKLLKYTTGVGADVTTDVQSDGTVTITIKGNDISVNSTNQHTYTLHFTKGVSASLDDEPYVTITPETSAKVTSGTFAEGVYYISTPEGKYLDEGQLISPLASQQNGRPIRWTVTGVPGSWEFQNDGKKNTAGHYLHLGRKSSAENFSADNFNVWTSSAGTTHFSVKASSNNTWAIYQPSLQYFDGSSGFLGWGAKDPKSGDVYLCPSEKSELICRLNSVYGWVFEESRAYDRIHGFWPNYAQATTSNGVDANALRVSSGSTASDLPLGLYSISGSGGMSFGGKLYTVADGVFYLPAGTSVTFSGTPNLSYYGRLDFSLTTATYAGTPVQDGQVKAVYDAKLFACTATGNGVQEVKQFYDEDTNELTVTVSGYGRSREHVFQFSEPDLSLNATWYGKPVNDGDVINEPYNASKLIVTPGLGTTAKVDYEEGTGVATITITSALASATYTIQFPVYPAAAGEALKYTPLNALKNGAAVTTSGAYVITPLEGGNIDFQVENFMPLRSITARNISVNKDGSFSFAGMLRATDSQLYPVTLNGHLDADGKLLDACVDFVPGNKELWHTTYGLTTESARNYTYDIVVTINGDATRVANNTISVGNLNNGNINFALKDFKMNIAGQDSYIGNIFIENLPIDQDGNFQFDGGILIGPGSDATKQYGGLDLGIVPVKLRGQRFNGGEDLLVVIDIDMKSLDQTIHVTLGADAVEDAKKFSDELKVTVNGETTSVPNTIISIAKLKNDNISFTLQDFTMNIDGKQSPIGNVTIDNIALDAKGNFTYEGIIRIGKGTDPNKEWGGPELGNVPVVIRGSVFDVQSGRQYTNCTTGGKRCQLVLDIDMQESLQQTIHVTYGLKEFSTKDYTDVLAVTVNGETTSQDATVTVGKLLNNNINFTLNNFTLLDENGEMPIGNIALENLILDETGHFTYEGSIRIGKGNDESKKWGGPELGDVPLSVNGLLSDAGMVFNIDIDMEAAIQQIINVTFGATPISSKSYTDDLKVTINGEATTTTATITMGELKAQGFYSFSLNNFSLPVNGSTLYVGNIAINALELDADGKFTYNGKIRIGEGDLQNVASWAGPDLGAIPMQLKGQRYEYEGNEYLLVSIAIDMQETIGQTIDVLFGGTPVRNINLHDNLSVSVNGDENQQMADVTVGILRNGNINFTLRNFVLKMIGEGGVENNIPVGNLSIDNLDIKTSGNFSFNGILRVGNGDDTTVGEWGGPALGNIPVELKGTFRENEAGEDPAAKAYVTIDIWMESLQQTINVVFGAPFSTTTLGALVQKIADMNEGRATKAEVLKLVDQLLDR